MADDPARRLARIRLLAWLLAALAVAVVAISAWVRLSAAGLGCPDFPACYGSLLASGASPHVGIVRSIHRLAASAALLLAFAVTWQCLRPSPLQPAARQATLLLVLMLVLAAVGLWSANPHRALPIFINILGGLALVSFSWRLVLAASSPTALAAPQTGALLKAGLASLAATMALGALIGARYGAVACVTLPFCGDSALPTVAGFAALNPVATVTAAPVLGDAGGVALHLLHRYLALATLLLLGVAGLRALAAPVTRFHGRLLLGTLVAETMLGALTVASGYSLPPAILHSVGAAILLATTAHLIRHR